MTALLEDEGEEEEEEEEEEEKEDGFGFVVITKVSRGSQNSTKI